MSAQVLRRFAVGGTAALALLLQACGGGGGSGAEDPQAPLSVVQYAASVGAAASAPLTHIDVGPQAQNFNDSRIVASDMLRLALAGGAANAAAVPSLLYAQLDLWRAAASGDTLAQLNRVFPLPADPTVAQARSNPVTRQLWAQRGATFTPAFLAASRLPDLGNLGPRWQAAETGFGDLSHLNDSALQQALAPWAALSPRPTASDFSRLRLWALDAVALQLSLPTPEAFDGVFQTAAGSLLAAPLLRYTSGVQQSTGSDHEAQVLMLGTRRLVAIRPPSGTLADYLASNRWIIALDEVMGRLNSGSTTPGTLVLPAGVQALATASPTWLSQLGLTLPFDPVNANLRSLDGRGGTFVEPGVTNARLELGAAGLGFAATAASSFVFNPANVNGPNFYAGTFNAIFPDFNLPENCPHADVDLRPFILALIDEFNAVQWVAAIGNPSGALACTAIQAAGPSGASASVDSSFFLLPPRDFNLNLNVDAVVVPAPTPTP